MAVWIWFIILFAGSWLPWGVALSADIKPHLADDEDKAFLKGLSIMDTTLTIASVVFLFLWIHWWALLIFGLMIGLAFIFEGLALNPYKAIQNGHNT